MLARWFLWFVAVQLVELALLFWIAQQTNWLFTIGLVIVTGVLGALLARHERLRCWRAAREKLLRDELPTDPLLDGLLVLLAGALLIMPGVLTDVVGFALLVPPSRRYARRRLANWIRARFMVGRPGASWNASRDEIIDVRVLDDKRNQSD